MIRMDVPYSADIQSEHNRQATPDLAAECHWNSIHHIIHESDSNKRDMQSHASHG